MRRILYTAICLLILTAISIQPSAVHQAQERNEGNFSPSDVTILEMQSDYDLHDEPTLIENGYSGEFSAWHSGSERYNDYGFVELKWIQTSGTDLNTTGDDKDYAGCSFSFEWEHEEIPRNFRPQIDVTINKTGDFRYPIGDWASYLSVYVVDPSQNWLHLGSSFCSPGFQSLVPYVNSWVLETLFGGMVEDEYGVQEDPSDTLTLIVMLEPGHEFDPVIDGSITITVHKVHIDVIRTGPPAEPVLEPGRERTWESNGANAASTEYPDLSDHAESFRDYTLDLVTAADGSIYGLVSSDLSVARSATVLKWNPRLQLEWYYRVFDIYTEALAVSDEAIYVAGYTHYYENASDISLTKLNLQGDLQWSETYDLGLGDSLRSVAVDDDNEFVYVLVNTGLMSHESNMSLIQVDHLGDLNWATMIPGYYGVKVDCSSDGRVYTHDRDYLREWDSDGDILWNRTILDTFSIGPNGSIYCFDFERTTDRGNQVCLTKLDADGDQLWNTTYRVHYSYNRNETILHYDHVIANNGSLFMSVYLDDFALETRLLHFNTETGAFIESRMLTEESGQTYAHGYLAIGEDGYLYRFRDHEQHVILYSYSPPDPGGIGAILQNEMFLIVGAAGIAVVVVSIFLFRRRR